MAATVANKYSIEGTLGSGGTGVVLAARHLTLSSRRVAIKHLHAGLRDEPEVAARFVREAQTAAALSHPHVVAVYDVEQDPELGPLVVMEFLQGAGLDALLKREGPLAWPRAARLMLQALDAVGYAHARGVVHRDLKPANLFVLDAGAPTERIKVLDFGIARVGEARGMTEAGAFVGTPRYASPEQRASAAGADARSDVYSLGVTLLEMLAGRPAPLIEGTRSERALQIAAALGGRAPEALVELVVRALEPAPDDRFATAAAMREALASVLRAAGEPAPEPAAVTDAALLGPVRSDPPPPNLVEPSRPTSSSPVSSTDQAATVRARPSSSPPARASDSEPTTAPRNPRSVPPAAVDSAQPGGASDAPAVIAAQPVPSTAARPSRRRALWLAAGGLVAASGAAVALVGLRAQRAAAGTALSPAERAALERAAGQWAAAMLGRQDARGALAYEPGRVTSGWDTGQILMGLFEARAACGAPDSAPLLRAVRALDQLRGPTGWSGVPSPGEGVHDTSVATAWVVLALARAASALGGAELRAQGAAARAVLLRSQRSDGAFVYRSGAAATDPPHAYASVLATWALLDAEPLEPDPAVLDARRRAVAWVRAQLASVQGEPPLRSVAGLAEQAAWVLARARATRGDREGGDCPLLAGCARDLVARCRPGPPPERACGRALVDDGAVPLPPGGQLQMLWFPWSMSAAAVLSRATDVPLDAALRDTLRAVVRWGAAQIVAGAPAIALAPSYKIAEYTLALAEILRAQPPA